MLTLHIPDKSELYFRKQMLEDAETMSYNDGYGGAIGFPEERFDGWYALWAANGDGTRFYRYLSDGDRFVGEIAYRYDTARRAYFCDVLIYAPERGKGYGSAGLELLCAAAKSAGISELYDEIGADNPAVTMFMKRGFKKVGSTDKTVILKKEL